MPRVWAMPLHEFQNLVAKLPYIRSQAEVGVWKEKLHVPTNVIPLYLWRAQQTTRTPRYAGSYSSSVHRNEVAPPNKLRYAARLLCACRPLTFKAHGSGRLSLGQGASKLSPALLLPAYDR